jgi:hypothetical protein
MLDQGCGLEASPKCVRRQFLADILASKLKGNTKRKKKCILLMKFLAALEANTSIVNIELTKIKVTVGINLKWHNLSYHCYLVGRHTECSCDYQTLYSLIGFRIHDYENWPVVICVFYTP